MTKRARFIRALAWARAWDAGNESMRAAGRRSWDREDFNAAARVFATLWPAERGALVPAMIAAINDRMISDARTLQCAAPHAPQLLDRLQDVVEARRFT